MIRADAPGLFQDRFCWHPKARLFGSSGPIIPTLSGPFRHAIPQSPATGALCAVLASAAAGLSFRIGGGDDPPLTLTAPAFETLTSGSTGRPRRILRSQASWIASFQVNAALLGIGPGAKVAVLGHLVQSLALYGAVEAIHLGAELHLLCDLRPDRQLAALQDRRITHLYASPAQMRQLLDRASDPIASLQCLIIGGSKLDPATRRDIAVRFPDAQIREFYGTAEASFITMADAATPPASVGRAFPGVELSLTKASAMAEDQGLVRVRSPYLFAGYPGDRGSAEWQDGWLATGEIGSIRDGNLYILGRADRMVTIADQNVFPEEIEAFLLTLPGVTRAAVILRPDRRRGHVVDAVVEGGTATDILALCRTELGPLKSPRNLHRIPEWPLMPSGKTDLASLMRAFP